MSELSNKNQLGKNVEMRKHFERIKRTEITEGTAVNKTNMSDKLCFAVLGACCGFAGLAAKFLVWRVQMYHWITVGRGRPYPHGWIANLILFHQTGAGRGMKASKSICLHYGADL